MLETRVIPVIQDESAVTILKGRVDDHENRIGTLEQGFKQAADISHTAPNAKRK